jgi:hypothetical protein
MEGGAKEVDDEHKMQACGSESLLREGGVELGQAHELTIANHREPLHFSGIGG